MKRQARAVMRDVTQCPPDTLPAHLRRVYDLQEFMRFASAHGHLDNAETRISGEQLSCPSTVMDFYECLTMTRKHHRAPVLLEGPDAERMTRIETKLETIASYLEEVAHA